MAPLPSAGVARGDRVSLAVRPEHILVPRDARHVHDPRDVVLEARIVADTAHPLHHSLQMETTRADDAGKGLILDVDVPSHPYTLLNLSPHMCQTVVLPFEHMLVLNA